jgi:cell division protein FtsI (penicillin-binding protein 3)
MKKVVLNPSICSEQTLNKVKIMLENVVNEKGGTAYNINSKEYKIAGKTGTGQVDYNTDNAQYISSFVGYFPSEKPKYSCIVVIHKPNKKKGYYGNIVAAPVFKKIADKLYSLTPEYKETNLLDDQKLNDFLFNELNDINVSKKLEINGKNFSDILPYLENLGFSVEFKGTGLVVKKHTIIEGASSKKIILELS